jgi:ribose 5-phosphate isomerase B
MTVFMAADHAGFELKEQLKNQLASEYEVTDLNPEYVAGDDYPLVAKVLAQKLSTNPGSFGIAICGSAQGICMALNRFRGIRAGFANSLTLVELMREHNNANVLCLTGRYAKPTQSARLVSRFLKTEFKGEKRHQRRIGQLDNLTR